jgi:hypothetical protein
VGAVRNALNMLASLLPVFATALIFTNQLWLIYPTPGI